MFDLDSRACHELNQTGAQILSLLDGRRGINDVVSLLAEMLNASKETIREDTEVFLKDLIGRGWVYVSQR